MEPLYSIMAQCLEAMRNCLASENTECLEAMRNCLASENTEWYDVWQEVLNDCVEYLPRGSGFDDYPALDEEVSSADKLAFIGAYHAMDENGSYKAWINYRVIVTPSFTTGIKLTVKYVRDTSLREYIADCFNEALRNKRDRNEMIADVRRKLLPGLKRRKDSR